MQHRETAIFRSIFVQKSRSTKQLWLHFWRSSQLNFFTRFSPTYLFQIWAFNKKRLKSYFRQSSIFSLTVMHYSQEQLCFRFCWWQPMQPCLGEFWLCLFIAQLQVTNMSYSISPNDTLQGQIHFAGDLHQAAYITLQEIHEGYPHGGRKLRLTSESFIPSQHNPYSLTNFFPRQQLRPGTYLLSVNLHDGDGGQTLVKEAMVNVPGKWRA